MHARVWEGLYTALGWNL